jgi:hypothetical protein
MTLGELAELLDPPLTPVQLKHLVDALGIEPAGSRVTGGRGRPTFCYRASQLMKLHAAVVPFCTGRPDVNEGMTTFKAVP